MQIKKKTKKKPYQFFVVLNQLEGMMQDFTKWDL